jgi:hypothetical protein
MSLLGNILTVKLNETYCDIVLVVKAEINRVKWVIWK